MRLYLPILLLVVFSCTENKEGIYPEVGSLTESVYASVTVQPKNVYEVHAAVGGIIEAYLVEEGDTVTLNQPIAQIKNTAPQLNVSQARLSLEQARQNYTGQANMLNELKDQRRIARLQYQDDSISFARQQRLWKEKVGTQVEYDRRKLAFELAKNNLEALENRLARIQADLKTQLQQAQVNYQTALSASADFRVLSKMKGKVYALYKEPGELISPQEPLATIGDASQFLVEMLIDEVDIARVQEGQQVYITLDAYGEKVYEAKLIKIYPQKNSRSQTFKVEAAFTKQPAQLYAGLSGEANILINRKEKTLSIPLEYLIDGSKVRTEGGLVEVSTGLQNLERVEILSGIDKNTQLLKPE